MSTPAGTRSSEHVLDFDMLHSKLDTWQVQYAGAEPFDHIVIDDFLDSAIAEKAMEAFPGVGSDHWIHYLHFNEKKHGLNKLASIPAPLRKIIEGLNSEEFAKYLSELTGIPDLIPDTSLEGGGLHQSQPGGFLNVHTDFTAHPHHKDWRRRVNVLIYLNKDWEEAYNGYLELWNGDMSECVQRIGPDFNRCVIFTTDDKSYHGHPDPLACPPGETRKSIALYYFTADNDSFNVQSTRYIARPEDNAKRLMIRLDNLAVSAYSKLKRNFGFGDGVVSRLLRSLRKK